MNNFTCFDSLILVNIFKDIDSELFDLFWLCFTHLINSKDIHLGSE